MFYKYETHLHTAEVSKCAKSTAVEMVRGHYEAGYAGIIVTDHFINPDSEQWKGLSWEEQVSNFTRGYEISKAEGDRIGLDVFFGFEYSNRPLGEDYLTYNIDKQFLLDHPEIVKLSIEEYCKLIRGAGGFISQAHPYREAWYIKSPASPKIHLVDAIEVNNGSSDDPDNFNYKAWELARANPQLIRTSGTDIHQLDHELSGLGVSGMAFKYKLRDIRHFIEALRAGDGYLIIDGKVTDREGNIVE